MNVLDFANEYLFKTFGVPSNAGCESKEGQFEYLMNKNDPREGLVFGPDRYANCRLGLSFCL